MSVAAMIAAACADDHARRAALAGAAWAPSDDPGLVRWWRADLGVTLASGVVQHWDDQITAARMTQATPARRPSPGTGINGQATIEGTGAHGLFGDSFPSIAQRWVCIAVMELTSAATGQVLIDDGRTAGLGIQNSPAWYWDGTWKVYSSSVLDTGDTAPLGASAWILDGNGASTKIYRDSISTPLITGSGGGHNTDSLGVLAASNWALHATGRVAEIILTTSAPSTFDSTVPYRGYLNDRYALGVAA